MVVDRTTSLPLYHPNLYLTTQVRNKGDASSSMEAAAAHLSVMLSFFQKRGIDLELRITSKNLLQDNELDGLRDFTQRNVRQARAAEAVNEMFTMEEMEQSADVVSSGTQYARLTTIAGYLSWLCKHLVASPTPGEAERTASMTRHLKAGRPRKRGRNEGLSDRSLTDIQLDTLFEVLRPRSALNPFHESIQRRNRLMILLLYHLGIRGGELLNVRIRDICFESNQLKVVRRPDETDDPRTREPNAKTLDRRLPLGDTLVKELHEYIIQDRRMLGSAKNHDFLIVTHKTGPTYGQPLSIAAYHKVVAVVRYVSPTLHAVTGHKLRHTWNRKFSEKMDSMDAPPSPERQEQMRSYLMGWKQGSGTAATYNQRFVALKGMEAALLLQQKVGIRQPLGVGDGH
ncbi:site-specific integrase [Pseudomonas sp. OIL-1]|nr:site-specific integrase [Pseudomonas sp. OIL-1]